MQRENADIKKETSDSEQFVADLVGVKGSLSVLDRAALQRVAAAMGRKIKEVDRERIELRRMVSEGQAARVMLTDTQTQLSELRAAHAAQQEELRRLQKVQKKVDTYRATIALQEKVITKMQKAIESRLTGSSIPGAAGKPLRNSMASNFNLEELMRLAEHHGAAGDDAPQSESSQRQQQQQTGHDGEPLTARSASASASASSATAMTEELQQVKSKLATANFKVAALQEQVLHHHDD